jgi:hypothetical protein
MNDIAKLRYKLHQLQKRLTRGFKNEGHTLSLKSKLRISRVRKIKETLRKLISDK